MNFKSKIWYWKMWFFGGSLIIRISLGAESSVFEMQTDFQCFFTMKLIPCLFIVQWLWLIRYIFFKGLIQWEMKQLIDCCCQFYLWHTKYACPWLSSSTDFTFTLCTLKSFLFSQLSAVTDMLSLLLRQALRVSTFVLSCIYSRAF